jgi:hypothetical protein
VLATVRDREVAQVRQILEHLGHVEMRRQLSDLQREYLVAGRLELLDEFLLTSLIPLALEQRLNSALNESLLEAAAVVLLLAILELHTLFLPVELVIDVARRHGDVVIRFHLLHDGLEHIFIVYDFIDLLRVQLEVRGDDLERLLDE